MTDIVELDEAAAAKIDAPLRIAYAAATRVPSDDTALARLAKLIHLQLGTEEMTAGVLMRASASDEELDAIGLVVTSQIGEIVAGMLPIAALTQLAALPTVERIEASVMLRPSAP